VLTGSAFGQDDDERGSQVREKMVEFIQKRLNISKGEAERFEPVFLNYFNELRNTNQKYKSDALVRNQKIAELKLNYRNQFRDILGEKRGNEVFDAEKEFINGLRNLREERMKGRGNGPLNKRSGGLIPGL
jgi:hypothetical protein